MLIATKSRAEPQSLPNSFQAEVRVMRDDYPFGMETQPKAGTVPGQVYVASEYRYGFNGIGVKKRVKAASDVKGTGDSYDFGAWMYDPRVGRWWNRDGKATLYRNTSPYVFGLNSPVSLIDSDGNEIFDSNGKRVTVTEENGKISFNPDISPGTRELLELLANSTKGSRELRWMNQTVSKIQIIETDQLLFVYDSRNGQLEQCSGVTIAVNPKLFTDSDGSLVYKEQQIIVSKGSFQVANGDLSKLENGGKALVIDEYNDKMMRPKAWLEKHLDQSSEENGGHDNGELRNLLSDVELKAIQYLNVLAQEDLNVYLERIMVHEPNHAHSQNDGLDGIEKEVEAMKAEAQMGLEKMSKEWLLC